MLLQRFVKFIPIFPNNKKKNEFVISENCFTWCTCELDTIKANSIPTTKNPYKVSLLVENNNSHCFEFVNIAKFIQEIEYEDCNQKISAEFDFKIFQHENILRKLCFCPNCIEEFNKNQNSFIGYTKCICSQFTKKQNIHLKLKMDIQLFCYLITELERSHSFCRAVIKNLYFLYNKKHPNNPLFFKKCDICKCTIEFLIASVSVLWPSSCIIDKEWNKRISLLVNEKCEVENAMSWLSTLGGAYSSLGDYFLYCAKQAENISVQQFKLALRLGDPLTIVRCKIYFAMSLVQQGYFTEAKRIIRKQYAFSLTKTGLLDFRLANMCKAIWNKLKYLESEDKELHAQKICNKTIHIL